MKYVPRPYQEKIISKIVSTPRCAIWAGMGMGKTSATLEALRRLKGEDCFPVLIIAPLRVAQSTWPDEISKWEDFKDLRVRVITGGRHERESALHTEADIYTINFEQIPWIVTYWKNEWPYKTIVVDEATRLKGFRIKQGALRPRYLSKIVRYTKRFIELTGTPAPNGIIDLWGQTWFLDGGKRLGSTYNRFLDRWFFPLRKGRGYKTWMEWVPGVGSSEEIKESISDITLTVNPEDYFDLSSNIVNEIPIKLPEWTMKQYRKFGRQLWVELESGTQINAVNAGVKTGKLLQFASGAVYTHDGLEWEEVHDQKIMALRSVVEEANGAPVLCAYSFRHEVDRILKAFPKARILDKDPQTIKDWNNGEIQLLLAHPASCGHGLNLQDGGNILVFFSCTWNLEHHDQIIERIGAVRQAQSGHKRSAFIHYLVAKGTIDEAVRDRLQTKRDVQDILLSRKDLLCGD